VHLVLVRLDARVPGRQFTVLLMALLVAQFLIADEMVATLTLAGAAALFAGWIFGDHRVRRGIEGLAPLILLAYLGAAALMTPWLYYVFRDFLHKPLRSPQEYSIDVLNLVLPTPTAAASSLFAALGGPSVQFSGNVAEQSGYIGAPLLAVVAWFAIARRRMFAGRILMTMLLFTTVLAMGPRLHMAGHAGATLPWRLVARLPLLNQALPARVFLYSTLTLSIVAAMWFSGPRTQSWPRLTMATAVLLSLLPNFSSCWAPYARRNMVPEFFSSGQYRSYIGRDEIVAVPPSGWGAGSEAMLWQATTGMYFRLASGYLPFAPASTFEWPIVTALMQGVELPDAADQWIAYAANHRASLAMTCERARSPALKQMFEELGVTPIKVGGATLYRVTSEALAKYRDADAARMEAVEQKLRFRELLLTARTYLESEADPAKLKLTTAFNPGLHAIEWKPWGMQPQDSPVVLRAIGASNVLIGVTGSYAAIYQLIVQYGGFARSLYFPFPHRWGEFAPPKNHCPRPLAMVFDLPELRRALQSDTPAGQSASVP
jgi:hypothetical protein